MKWLSVIDILPCLLYIQPIEILGSGKKETNAINTGINLPVCNYSWENLTTVACMLQDLLLVFFKVVWDICGY